MHLTGEYTIADLAALFSVSRATVYRVLGKTGLDTAVAALPADTRPQAIPQAPFRPCRGGSGLRSGNVPSVLSHGLHSRPHGVDQTSNRPSVPGTHVESRAG
jgi:hypothetical protein